MKKAFTMLELIFVIIILGIIASIGAEIITKLYDNYIKTRSINRLQAQTELVLDQIAKRLSFRIKDSTMARKTTNFSQYVSLPNADSTYQILEWIGKDNESFLGESNGTAMLPGWSGFIDLNSNDTNKSAGTFGFGTLKTPGSELNVTDVTIQALSAGAVTLANGDGKPKPAIIFRGQSKFDIAQYGWGGVDGNYTFKVSYIAGGGHNDILNLDDNLSAKDQQEIYEQYDLAWSAYAIVPVGNANDFNLTFYYNYRPWENKKYSDGNSSVLAEHVSSFKFRQDGDTIRLKLCIRDNSTNNNDYGFCKEKVVF